jgi:hypothetical protein
LLDLDEAVTALLVDAPQVSVPISRPEEVR